MAYTGKQSFVLVGEESAYNTAVATVKDLGVITSVDASLNNNPIDIDAIGRRQATDILAGSFDGSLSFNGVVNSGAIMEMFFGQSEDLNSLTDYRHVFVDKSDTITTSPLPLPSNIKSYTLSTNHDGTSDTVFTYSGGKVNTLNVGLEYGGALTFDAEVIIGNVTTSTSLGTQVTTTTIPLIFSEGTVKLGNEGSETAKCPISNFNLSMNNNIDTNDIRCIGNRKPSDLLPKKLELTGDFTARFGSKDEAERFIGGSTISTGTPTDTGIVFEVTNGIAYGSGNVSFYVKLLGCQYESLGRNFSQDGIVEESFSFRATEIDVIYFTDSVSSYF